MATTITFFVYWSDGLVGQAFDYHSRNEGRTFANENCQLGRALTNCFKCLGFAQEDIC